MSTNCEIPSAVPTAAATALQLRDPGGPVELALSQGPRSGQSVAPRPPRRMVKRSGVSPVASMGVGGPTRPAGDAQGLGGHSPGLELERQSSPPGPQGSRPGRGEPVDR